MTDASNHIASKRLRHRLFDLGHLAFRRPSHPTKAFRRMETRQGRPLPGAPRRRGRRFQRTGGALVED